MRPVTSSLSGISASDVSWHIVASFDGIDGEDGRWRKTGRKSPAKKGEAPSGQLRNRVLLFSGLWELALYRAEVLRNHGFHVVTPRTKQEAIQAIKRKEIDVVVLTYTLPNETVHEVTELLRSHCPSCLLVAISESGQVDRKIAPDATVVAEEGPAGLIRALRSLAHPS